MSIEHPQEHKSRLGGHSYFYCDIAEREFSRSLEVESLYNNEDDEFARSSLEDQYAESGVKAIIFSALSLEAGINDYAAWQLGDSYFEKHLSSLDVLSKWVVIPRLICDRSIDKSGPAFSSFKRLISARNDLVHNKSKRLDVGDPKLAEKLKARSDKFDGNIINSYRAVILMSLTMDKLVGGQFNPLRSFSKEQESLFERPKNVIDIVNDCRNVISRNHS